GEGGLCSTHELSPPQITRPPNRIPESSPHLSPLPKGEGQGEGKRSEVKNPASKPTTGHQPFLSTAVLKHRTPHAAAIPAAHSNFAERLECGGSPPLSKGIRSPLGFALSASSTCHGARRKPSQRTVHWPLSGNPGAGFAGAPSHPPAIMPIAYS